MSSVHRKESSSASSYVPIPDSFIEFSLIVKEYTGLIKFVSETPAPGYHQLSHFIFPFYVYIYLFLLKNQKFNEAERFISVYSRLFLNAEGYAEIVQDLLKFKTLEDFQGHNYLKNFCESKHGYKVKLSEGSLKLLKEYLEATDCRILSHILHRQFNIQVTEDESYLESSTVEKKEFTSYGIENLESKAPTRSIVIKKTNRVIKDESDHGHTTKSLPFKKKESTKKTKKSENSSSTSIVDLKETNSLIKDKGSFGHTTESSPVKKKESVTQRTVISKNSSSTKSLDIQKTKDVIEDQSNFECTTEALSGKEKGLTSQKNEISNSSFPTKSISVTGSTNRLSSKVPCYHYTISCRKDQLCCVDINQKNTLLACGFESSEIQIWNTDTNVVTKSLDTNESNSLTTNIGDDGLPPSLRCVLNGHGGGVYGLAYASGLLMSCSEDTTVRAWSMTDFKDVRVYCDHKYPIWDITVSYNCAYFATASLDCTARLWSFNRATPLRIFVGHSSDVDHVRFHSNGRYLATASADKTIQLWAVEDGRSMRKFPGHDTHINSIVFSPDGKHIASADDNGLIKIWDLASGKLYSEIAAHSKKILSISYNSDSSLIASCGIDRYIKIWDVKHSICMDKKEGNEDQAKSLVDSHLVDSVPHYVSFRQRDFLLSIGVPLRTEK